MNESGSASSGKSGATQASPTRVLMVLDSFSFGGAENLVAELGASSPASLSVQAASLAPASQDRNAMFGRLADAGVQPMYLSVRRLLDVKGFAKLVRTLKRAPVDVVHAHLGYSAILVPLAARLAGKPVVATLHLSPQRHSRRGEWLKERLSVRIPARFGRLVLVSQHAYDEYARVHGPASAKWRMIPNGVNLERYSAAAHLRSNDAPVWAVVAALRPDKNHVGLILAWQQVVSVHPEATLVIIGDGPSRGDIERAICDAGVEKSVRMIGRREDVPELLRSVDGVVSASLDEALPTALIEAGACRLPVVATDAGGTREIVLDGVTGRLVPMHDVAELAKALLNTMADPEKATAYGNAGRALAEERYSLTRWIENLERLYAEVASVRKAPGSMLTVAHVIHSLGAGGAESVLGELARAAPPARLRMVVIGLSDARVDNGIDNRMAPRLRKLGAVVYELHAARYDPSTAARVSRILRDHRVDVVHTHLKHADVVGGIAARIARVPAVSTLHVIDVPKSRLDQVRLKVAVHARRRLSTNVIALSSAQLSWYRAYAGSKASIKVVPNGVAEPEQSRDPRNLRAELKIPEGTLLALCVSLMRPEKGHAVLLKAIRLLPADVPVSFALAGDGPLLSVIRAEVESDPALLGRVQVLGFREDVSDLLAACDFVIHPSLEDALPTALISALAAGKPIVATNVGGIPDIVRSDCGTLVDPSRPLLLRNAIEAMVLMIKFDRDSAASIRRAARRWYEQRFAADVWVQELRSVYLAAINAGR